jgi:hypothetical protein
MYVIARPSACGNLSFDFANVSSHYPQVLSCDDNEMKDDENLRNSTINPILQSEVQQHEFLESLPPGVKKNMECADGSVLVDPEQVAIAIWYRHRSPMSKILIYVILGILVLAFRIGSPFLVAFFDENKEELPSGDKLELAVMILLIICGYLLQHTMLLFVVVSTEAMIKQNTLACVLLYRCLFSTSDRSAGLFQEI